MLPRRRGNAPKPYASAHAHDIAVDDRLRPEVDRPEDRDDLITDLAVDARRTDHRDDLTRDVLVLANVDVAEDAHAVAAGAVHPPPFRLLRRRLDRRFRRHGPGRDRREERAAGGRIEVRQAQNGVGVGSDAVAQFAPGHDRAVHRDRVRDFDEPHVAAPRLWCKRDAVRQRHDVVALFESCAQRPLVGVDRFLRHQSDRRRRGDQHDRRD